MKVLDLVNFEKEAERIISGARSSAEEVISTAVAEAERMKKSGYEEGVRAGKEAMEQDLAAKERQLAEKVSAELNAANETLVKAFSEEIKAAVTNELSLVSSKITDLAIAVAGRILKKEAAADPSIVNNVIMDALNYVSVSGKYTIRVNGASTPAVSKLVASLKSQQLFSRSQFEVVADNSIEAGGCKIAADGATIDATLGEQLKRMEEFLK